jgi:hypothetical protein
MFPHPYRDHSSIEEIAECVDFIEIWNGRSTLQQNMAAQDLATRFSKLVMYGSDAHVSSEIGSVKTRIDPESFQFRELLTERYSTASEIHRSQIISLVKQRKWGTLISQGTRYIGRKVWRFP